MSDDVIAAKIAEYMKSYADNWPFSGNVLVAKDGHVLFEQCFGLSNREHLVPNKRHTKFRIASISKSFTAIRLASTTPTTASLNSLPRAAIITSIWRSIFSQLRS